MTLAPKMTESKSDDAEAPSWGPAMASLPEKRRQFVLALYSEDAPRKGDGLFDLCRAGCRLRHADELEEVS